MTQIPRRPPTPLTRAASTRQRTAPPAVLTAPAIPSDATVGSQTVTSPAVVSAPRMASVTSDASANTVAPGADTTGPTTDGSAAAHGHTSTIADAAPASPAASDPAPAVPVLASAAPPLPAWAAIADTALDQIAPYRRARRSANREESAVSFAPSFVADDQAGTVFETTAFAAMTRSARQDFTAAMISDHPDYRMGGRDKGGQGTVGQDTDVDDADRPNINEPGPDGPGIEDQQRAGLAHQAQKLAPALRASHGVRPPAPLATALDAAQSSALLAAHDDPWAMDLATRLYHAPGDLNLTYVLPLARFCAACGDQPGIDGILSDGSATVILCDGSREVAGLAAALLTTRLATPHAAGTSHAIPHLKPRVVTLPTGAGSGRAIAMASACDGLKGAEALVVLAEDATDLSHALAMLPILQMPPLDRDMILYTLRTLQSATGLISTDAVQDILPSSTALAGLTLDTLLHAFRARGPLRVAARIAELAAAQPTPIAAGQDGPQLADLPGLGAARAQLFELVADMRAHAAGTLPWGEVTSGLILAGPPGTGKTTLAAAIARSAGVPLIATTCSDWHRGGRFNDMIAAMSAVFEDARSRAPAVLFIDEIDSLGSRSARADQNASYNRHVINAVLSQIDGAQGRDGVVIIGATNYAELLDPALTRPGRLGHTIHIAPPSERELPDVFRHHLGRDLPQIDLAPIARSAAGATMADVMSMVQAARAATRATGRALTTADLTAAVGDRYSPVSDALRMRHAIRAAAHIAAAHITGHARPVSATLTADGARTEVQPVAHSHDPAAVSAALITTLAGRAAEAILLGAPSGLAGGGPTSDLACATKTALTEALSLGRGDGLTWQVSDTDPALLFARHRGLRDTVDRRLHTAYARARALIEGNRAAVDAIAAHLVVDGHVDRDTLRDLLVFCVAQQEGK